MASIVAGDIVVYGAASIAEADAVTQGGIIDTSVRYVFDSSSLTNTLNDTVDIVSSAAGDTTQTVTVTGRNTAGLIISEGISLNGTTPVNGATTFERILKIVVSASHTGTITVSKNTGATTIVDIETGVLRIQTAFYDVSADASGGSSRDFYEKVFVSNNNATNAYLSAVVIENSDPSGKITFDLEDGQKGFETISDRLNTPPSNVLGSFDSANKNVPDTNLHATSGIGVWLKLTLAAGDAAAKTTYTIQTTGNTT